MRRYRDAIGYLLGAALLMAPERSTAQSALLEEAVGLSGIAMFLESGATGMVLAVVRGDDVVGFGETAKGGGREPDGKSLLRIGSISKTLAGELLGGLAAEGRLSLTDSLQRHAPEWIRIDTGVAPSEAQCARLMTGHGIPGAEAAPCVSTANIAASGGVHSTADDMVLWLRHNLARADAAAWPTRALTHAAHVQRQDLGAAIGFDEAGPMDAIALAWLIEMPEGHRPVILQKTDGLAGFVSYIAFAPGHDVGAFASVNRIDFGMFADLTEGVNDLIAELARR